MNNLIVQKLASRISHIANRLDVEPCDPETRDNTILLYAGDEGPVYDLVEVLDALLDKIEGRAA